MKKSFGVICATVLGALLSLYTGPGGTAAAVPGPGHGSTVGHTNGNLVTAVRHDYNGDGRSDMPAWYDYGDGHDAIRPFLAGADGTFPAPPVGWTTPPGNFWAEHMKHVTGDFDGDGIGDVAAFYGYDDGTVTLWTWLGNGDGTFADPFSSWTATPGNWTFANMTAQAGDFNGDGRDDVAVWYSYDNGDDKLFTMLADANGGFGAHFSSFQRTKADLWYVRKMKFAMGDFNGDGRDDLGVLYGYDDHVTLMSFLARPDGGFDEPVRGWESTGWTFGRASMYAGDFDGDGLDEFAAWYDYQDGHDAVISFDLGADGTFGNRREIANLPIGAYDRNFMKIVSGDYNGDGRDDLAALYGLSDKQVTTLTLTSRADGTLDSPVPGWQSAVDAWTYHRVRMIERHSSVPACPTVFGHGGYPTGPNPSDRDQIRQPNHPTGLAQQKSWGAGGVEADLQLTKDGTKGVMWHNSTTYGLTGTSHPIAEIPWATGADQLKGRTINRGPYTGETVYTFREWLDSAKAQGMAVLVELKGASRQSLLNSDPVIQERAWNEVLAPIQERVSGQRIMIYTSDAELDPVLKERVNAAGLGETLTDQPHWGADTVDWEEPPPPANGNFTSWYGKLMELSAYPGATSVATTWTQGLTTYLDNRCARS